MKTTSGTGKKRRTFAWLMAAVAIALACLAGDAVFFLTSPASSEPAEVVVTIAAGTPLPAVANRLEQRGLVRSAFRFSLLARLQGVARRIKAGEYRLSTGLRPPELLDKLVRGEVVLHQITFPEGFTQRQVASLLESEDLASSQRLLDIATDSGFIQELGIPASSLEGYLFPDTYRFSRNLPEERILRTMVSRFQQHITAADRTRARELGLSLHQVVTLASIVEKETAVAEERPLIAGVFFNRLERRIPLQSDPTVIYGLDSFDGNLTRRHLEMDTPYNTYTRRGLPPGPICNPGAASIEAVLHPASTPYLYFVAKKDGSHHFSATLRDHNAAVARHQKR